MPDAREPEDFESLVARAIDHLPEEFQSVLAKVAVIVSDLDGVAHERYEDRIAARYAPALEFSTSGPDRRFLSSRLRSLASP